MKKTILIFGAAMAICVTCLRAQVVDTLPFNMGPWYYMDNPLDSMRSCDHDGVHCDPGLSIINSSVWYMEELFFDTTVNGDIAYAVYPDSTLHIVGIACVVSNSFDQYSTISGYDYGMRGIRRTFNIVNQTDEEYDQILFRLYRPTGQTMQIVKSVPMSSFDTNHFTVYDYVYGMDFTRITYPLYLRTYRNMHYFSYLVWSVFFDEEVVMSDSLYLSCKVRRRAQSDGQLVYEEPILAWHETHDNDSYDDFIFNTVRYRKLENMASPDDSWECGEMHSYPMLFPIIRRDCDSCPKVRGVEVRRSSQKEVFLLWQGGANHLGWQVAYGPAGTPPEECTIAGEYTQMMSGLIAVDPDSQYVAYVRARCHFARDEWSEWSDPVMIWINNGIDEPQTFNVSIAPNPATGMVTVGGDTPLARVEFYDPQGRLALSLSASGTTSTVDISALPPAVYTVVVTSATGHAIRKVTVTR